ncbi:MAG: hypothetical protein KC766_10610 [Myxococcales bacterium]|nr:hypothetical protein [Myxococcales bacterium]
MRFAHVCKPIRIALPRRNALDHLVCGLQTARMTKRHTSVIHSAGALVWLVLVSTGCDRGKSGASSESKAGPSATRVAAPSAQRPAVAVPRGELRIAWDAAAPWVRQPLRARDVRRAAYAYPRAAGDEEDAQLEVFYFGPSLGGGVEPNLKRWAGQFGKAPDAGKTSKRKVGDIDLTLFEIEGTYQPGRPMAPKPPKPGFAMLGAIATVASSGNYFLKLTGPKATVEAARADFSKLLESLKEKSSD